LNQEFDMSEQNLPFVKVTPSYTADLGYENGQPVDNVFYSVSIEPVGFDPNAVGPVEDFTGAAIDRSTSMNSKGKFDLARAGGHAFLDALEKRYKDNNNTATTAFALYGIGSGVGRIYPAGDQDKYLPPLNTPDKIKEARQVLDALRATDGDTQIAPPMRAFVKDAINLKRKVNTLGMLTDGACSDNLYVTGCDPKGVHIMDGATDLMNQVSATGQSIKVLCFGIGGDWKKEQLNAITRATVSPDALQVSTDGQMREAFEQMASEGASQALTNVRIVIKKFAGTEVLAASVEKPESIDLMDQLKPLGNDETTQVINMNAWDNERRLILLQLGGLSKPTSTDFFNAAAIWVEYDWGNKTEKSKPVMVRVTWTDNVSRSSVIARGVAEGQGMKGSVTRTRKALAAASAGDIAGAEAALGANYKDAFERGDKDIMAMLEEHLEVIDAANGIVKLKDQSPEALRRFEGSSSSVRSRKRTTAATPAAQ
jgi:hypothetical protein